MTQGRRVKLKLDYNNKDISANLDPFLLNFSYTDHSSGQADDLQITLADRAGLWRGDWLPEKGATLQASIITENWGQDGKIEALSLGMFEIDEIELSGQPDVVTIKALSIPESSSLRGEVKTRAWEKTKLSVIAKDIASGAAMELVYDTDDDPDYDRIEQTEQSDLQFLLKLCNDAGLSLKVTDKQIVIFDDRKYEKIDTAMTIIRGVSSVSKYSATSSTRDVYSSCRVKYHNAKTKQDIDYTYTPPKFETSSEKIRTLDGMKRSGSARWATHDIMSNKPVLEFTGPGLEEISFSMRLDATLGINPSTELEVLRDMRDKGEISQLILNGKPITNHKWIVESLSENWEQIDNSGRLLVATVDVSLKEYVPPEVW